MAYFLRVLMYMAFSAALSGCASINGYPDNPLSSDVDLEVMGAVSGTAAIQQYYATLNVSARQTLRDEIIHARLSVYDNEYHKFARTLVRDNNSDTLAGDLTILGLNGFGAVAGGAATKAALAAASAGVSGANAHIDKDLYFDKTLPALVAQMDASRAAQLLVINQNLQQDDRDYPLPAALEDTYLYREAGSIPSAINVLTSNASAAKNDAKDAQVNGSKRGTATFAKAHRLVPSAAAPTPRIPGSIIRNLP